MAVVGLYVHVPFCRTRCLYCDFHTRALTGSGSDATMRAWTRDALARIDALGARGALADVETVYIGGGTPSILGLGAAELIIAVRRWCAAHEITCEANPESCTDEFSASIAQAGATRLSLGVQSLDDRELTAIGRIHTASEALAAIARARRCGLSVSCDLMCGLPGQTATSWRRSLCGVLGEGVEHISIYPLSVEPGTPLGRMCAHDPAREPDEDLEASLMESARSALMGAGFAPYEVASYARPGRSCAHNIAYWTAKSYLGVGVAAASMLARDEFERLRGALPGAVCDPDATRVRLVERRGASRFAVECLNAAEEIAEDLMLGMRMTEGVSIELVDRARRVIGADRVDAALRAAVRSGLAVWRGEPDAARLKPTERGWLLGNELFGLFWNLSAGPR